MPGRRVRRGAGHRPAALRLSPTGPATPWGEDARLRPCSSRALALQAALAVGAGFLLLVAGGAFADAMAKDYAWSDRFVDVWNLALGAGVGVVLNLLSTGLLEAVRSGHPDPVYDDAGRPHDVQVD